MKSDSYRIFGFLGNSSKLDYGDCCKYEYAASHSVTHFKQYVDQMLYELYLNEATFLRQGFIYSRMVLNLAM